MVTNPAAVAPILGFSTLACPEWGALEVVERAAGMGFGGIEWRGGPDGHVMGLTGAERATLRRAMADHGLVAISVTSYTAFVDPDPGVRAASVDDLVRHAEVAADLGATDVRAFPGEDAGGATIDTIRDRLADGLLAAEARLRGSGVIIALEPHDHVVASTVVGPLLERVGGPGIGVIWDIGNTWSVGEDPFVGLPLLRPWLRYVQVKDGTGQGSTWTLTHVGAGEVPLGRALAALLATGARPPISIEWERPWHPELPSAAEALPRGLAHLRALIDP